MFAAARNAAFGLLLSLSLGAGPAHAIFNEADDIEADGTFSTVDLWFFHFDADTDATFQVNDVTGLVAGSDTDLIIYADDGSFLTVYLSDIAAGSEASIGQATYLAGSYVAVVANHPLTVGDFGPTHADAALALSGYEYELNGQVFGGGNDPVFDCTLSGNLGGGYTKIVRAADTCRTPLVVAALEPSTFALFAAGLLGIGLALRRRSG